MQQRQPPARFTRANGSRTGPRETRQATHEEGWGDTSPSLHRRCAGGGKKGRNNKAPWRKKARTDISKNPGACHLPHICGWAARRQFTCPFQAPERQASSGRVHNSQPTPLPSHARPPETRRFQMRRREMGRHKKPAHSSWCPTAHKIGKGGCRKRVTRCQSPPTTLYTGGPLPAAPGEPLSLGA